VDPLFLDALAFKKDLEARTGVKGDNRAYLAEIVGRLADRAERKALLAELKDTTDEELEAAKAGTTWPRPSPSAANRAGG
jgi:cation transport regulator ChaC